MSTEIKPQKQRYLHLAQPLGTGPLSLSPFLSTGPLSINVHAQSLFSILDHALRRSSDQKRVIGTLLGRRSEDGSEIEIRNTYAVPYSSDEETVQIDFDYSRAMLALHRKANPKDIVVGWYSTGSSDIDAYSSLIQSVYSQMFPFSVVHMTVDADDGDINVATYISSSAGMTPDKATSSLIFQPIPHNVKYSDLEKAGLATMSQNKGTVDRKVTLTSDLDNLETAVQDVLTMVERVSKYVAAVKDKTKPANIAVGKFLLSNLSLAPNVPRDELERLFNSHLQDVLLVVYLANVVKSQLELSTRLASIV